MYTQSRDSSVGIALGYGVDGVLGFDSRLGLGIFLFTTASRTALGPTQPPIQWVSGPLSLAVKRTGREADRSPHLVPRSKNEWSYTSTPQYAFMAWCTDKAQGQLYLTLPLPSTPRSSGCSLVFFIPCVETAFLQISKVSFPKVSTLTC
jgi:hypothetical protein